MLARPNAPIRGRSLLNPVTDFWLLGGASILVWFTLVMSGFVRETPAVGQRVMQLGMVFSFLALLCNHPHFMVSYRIAYGRGMRFILEKWFPLLFIPGTMIAAYWAAYLFFDTKISENDFVIHLNSVFEWTGITFRLGLQSGLGTEILGLGAWFMYLTVGWHYAKQVFGCLMVYGYFDLYPLTHLQRRILKSSVFSVAFLQFTSVTMIIDQSMSAAATGDAAHTQAAITPIGLPVWLYQFSYILVGVTFVATLFLVFWRNFSLHKRLPSATFVVPWVAFHIWWVPLFRQTEFTFMIIPFFHSLQYLPFAYRMEIPKVRKTKYFGLNVSSRVILLLLIGFAAFEAVPNFLDRLTDPSTTDRVPWFFLSAFVVFINVHHFFIDSAIWKFSQRDVMDNVLHEPATVFGEIKIKAATRAAS
jgi:hypothetical protein